MIWQYIFAGISALMFFGFVILGVIKFKLLSCYSAYAPKWGQFYPKLNIWSLITALSAFLMVPVLVEQGAGNTLQFLGFLGPISLFSVAASPNYQTSTFDNIIHQLGAWGAVVFITLYSLLIVKMIWVILALIAISIVLGIWKKGTWMFWGEMAMYLSIYIILFIII